MMLGILLSSLLAFAPVSVDADAVEPVCAEAPAASSQRPKVALVLSGGGAKGIAHIGVIKYLREIGIPVDMVVGTSIGSIVGAMYSLGYDDKDMIQILSGLDWAYYLGDGVERSKLMYHQKLSYDRYDLDFPFGTGEITFGGWKSGSRAEASALLKSFMPSGIIEGNNILNLFYDMSIGYTQDMDFADLPIPFVCVSSNIVDGTANVHTHGVLPLALRASMSMPGVFNPVYNDSQVLVDGGIRDNFPVDIARQMGADIVIGVNLAIEKESDPEKLRPYLSQVSQLIKIFIGNGLEENNEACDVLIYPDLKGRTALDFSQKNMDELAQIGYDEAKKHSRELEQVHDLLAEFGSTQQQYNAPKAKNLTGKTFRLSQINFSGIKGEDVSWVIAHTGLKIWTPLTMADIREAVSSLYGTRAYSSVIYSLQEDMQGDYIINFELTPQKPHTLDLGIRLDSHDALQSVMRVGINEKVLHGVQAELVTKLSYNPSVNATVSYLPLKFPKLSFSCQVNKKDADLYEDGMLTNNLRFVDHRFCIYLSEVSHVRTSFRLGTQYERMSFLRAMSSYWVTSLDSKMLPVRTFGLFGEVRYDNVDNNCFPSRGSQATLRLDQNLWHFRQSGPDFRPFTLLNASYRGVIPLTEHFSLIPQTYAALNFDSACKWGDEEFPATYGEDMALGHNPVYPQKMGGAYANWDFCGQLPFAGFYHTASVDNAVILRLDTRYNITGNQYLTLKANYARSGAMNELFTSSGVNDFGIAVEYALDTLFGPLSCEIGWSTVSFTPGLFLSLGRVF